MFMNCALSESLSGHCVEYVFLTSQLIHSVHTDSLREVKNNWVSFSDPSRELPITPHHFGGFRLKLPH